METIIGYKLTDQDGYTRRGMEGETKWEVGAEVSPKGRGNSPCGPGVLHDYSHPLLAVLLNPVHACINSPCMFKVEHTQRPETDGLKRWTGGKVCVLEELPLPKVSTAQRVRFAILVAYPKAGAIWRQWADKWLSGEDRTAAAARAAAEAWAARAEAEAARAAWAAAVEAEAAWATWATWAAAEAWAAEAARAAAEAWAAAAEEFLTNLEKLAEQAVREEV